MSGIWLVLSKALSKLYKGMCPWTPGPLYTPGAHFVKVLLCHQQTLVCRVLLPLVLHLHFTVKTNFFVTAWVTCVSTRHHVCPPSAYMFYCWSVPESSSHLSASLRWFFCLSNFPVLTVFVSELQASRHFASAAAESPPHVNRTLLVWI